MNRTLRLLKPITSSSRALTLGHTALRPTSLALRPTPTSSSINRVGSIFPLLPLDARTSIVFKRGLATKDPNINVEQQNATTSAKDEIKSAAKDLAGIIRGSGHYPVNASLASETSAHGHGGSIKEDFDSITRGLVSAVPQHALYFGAAGLLPYLGTSIATIFLAREASRAANGGAGVMNLTDALNLLHTVEHVQITYGAIILSFLGAIHWGFEFAKQGGEQGWQRLAIGTLPVLFAWPTTFLSHGVALAAQWAGFTSMWFLDQRATSNGWTTVWYSTYRFYLSIVVGFSIIATLWGTGYYGAGAGAITSTNVKHTQHTTERVSPLKRLDRLKEKENPKFSGKQSGALAGDIQVDEREDGEGFLKLRNIAKEEDEAKEKEEEEKKAKAKQDKAEVHDKKDEGQMDAAPGRMKDSAPDRTGKNKNVEGGEERGEDEERTKGMADAVEKKKEGDGASGTGDKAVGDDASGGKGEESKAGGEKGEKKSDDTKKDGDGKGEAAGKKGAAGEGNTGMK